MNNELFWKLLESVHPMAEAFCRRLAGNRDEGDDLHQEGLLLALRKFGSLREKAAFRAWLFRLLINCYKNRRRSEWLTRYIRLTGKLNESVEGFDPRGQFDSRRWLGRALKALSPENRALIALYEIEGKTNEEIRQEVIQRLREYGYFDPVVKIITSPDGNKEIKIIINNVERR